jgi:hypothetical protein
MHDDLAVLLKEASDVPPPERGLVEVIRGGRGLRTLRRGGLALAAAVLAGTGWVGASTLLEHGRDGRQSVGPSDREGKPDQLLVPKVRSGQTPGPGAASQEAIEDARAITVGFHALLFKVGYDLDYRDVEQIDDSTWRLSFMDGLENDYLSAAAEARLAPIRDSTRAMRGYQDRLSALIDEIRQAMRVGDSDRVRELRREKAEVLRGLRLERKNIRVLERSIKRLEDVIKRQERQGGPFPVELVVELQGQELVVASIDSDRGSLESRLGPVVGYRERVEAAESWGVEYYNGRFTEPGEIDDVAGFEAHAFWTGPIPTSYEEKCLLQLVAEDGEVEWTQQDIHDLWEGAPPSEDRRDGWSRAQGIGTGGAISDGAQARWACEMRI